MKNFLLSVLLSSLFVSCGTEPMITEPDPLEPTCTIDLSVVICQNFQCQQVTAFSDVLVEIFASEQDAIDGISRLRSGSTDAEGQLSLGFLPCDFIWLRIVTEDRGVYIERFSLSTVASTNFEQVEFVEGLIYQNGSEGFATQTHISFTNPILGQESIYQRFEIQNYIDYEITEYTDNMLSVSLVNQLDENTYVVEEKIDVLDGMLQWPFYPGMETVRSQWTFYGDSIRVSPHGNEYFASFVWNLSEYFENSEADGYTFSLDRPTDPLVDMSEDLVAEAPGFGVAAAADYTILDQLFSDLIVDVRSYTGLDGPKKLCFYNREDGLVRSIDFFAGMSQSTHGFDLLLE